MPGLIEGAHEGHGLGHQFLRHVERTRVLVHVVDVSSATGREPAADLDAIRRELELFAPALVERRQIVAANKMDALDEPDRLSRLEARAAELGLSVHRISAVTGTGLAPLLEAMWAGVAGNGAE